MDSDTKPTLLYDGDCRFCKTWVGYWKKVTGDTIRYAPYQEVMHEFPNISQKAASKAVQLLMPDGRVYSAAEAVFQAYHYAGKQRWWLWMYQNVPGFRQFSEALYQFIAYRRMGFLALTAVFFGTSVKPSHYVFSVWIFLKILGIIYLIAFLSFGVQAMGLIGSRGILPVRDFMLQAHTIIGSKGIWTFPTLFWFSSSDFAVKTLPLVGALCAVLLIAGIVPRVMLILLFFLYLSLVHGGQTFMAFQWDTLLLETGFLAIFLTPNMNLSVFLFWVLLFRFLFMSGAVKLMSHDPVWRDFSALTYHYQTQPLPTVFAWYMYQLPVWFHKVSVAIMFCIELVLPFFIFFPRHLRFIAGGGFLLLQSLIFFTGNYTFFNLLTVSLIVLLFDDAFWSTILPGHMVSTVTANVLRHGIGWPAPGIPWGSFSTMGHVVIIVFSIFYILMSILQFGSIMSKGRIGQPLFRTLEPFYIMNHYGLFAVMTTSRPEILIEGSRDGTNWIEYSFRHKPGDLLRLPTWVQPHQPRLDWQMWFAALGNYQQNPWFANLLVRLLEGSPDVLRLFRTNPFFQGPPRFIRAQVYEYRFTNFKERAESKAWWKRELKGLYFPVASLQPVLVQ